MTKVNEADDLYSIIIGSINYFNKKMGTKMELLKQWCLDRELRIGRKELLHKKEARCSRASHIS